MNKYLAVLLLLELKYFHYWHYFLVDKVPWCQFHSYCCLSLIGCGVTTRKK